MSESRRRYCIFGCDALFAQGVPLHRFPNPDRRPDLFANWITAVGSNLRESDCKKIYKNKRICDHHFDPTFKTTGGRLICSAIPTVNLNRIQQSGSTFVEIDHSYCRPRRISGHIGPMVDITNIPGPSGQPEPLPGPSSFELSSAVQSMELSVPSGSKQCHTQIPLMKFDPGKTVECIQKKADRKAQSEVRRLRHKLKGVKLRLQQLKKKAANREFEKLTQNMSESAKLFTRMQYIEGRKKRKGRRYTLNEKVLSLSIFKKSPKAYNLMCKHFTLPSKKVLKSLLAQVRLFPGINKIIFKELKSTVSKMLPQDRLCTLIFDEMSISPQIHYNINTDDLVGFENYGNCKTPNFANHVLVFMVKGVRKNYKQPVAYYFTQTLKSYKLKEIIVDVIGNVQATGLKIIATVCDQSSANVSAINSLITEAKKVYFQAGKQWRKDVISIKNCDIIPLFDVPHLLKGIRNNLITKEMQYMDEKDLKIIKWEYFQLVFEADRSHGELRILPKLTNEHIDPTKIKKMRVKHAAQILSHSMAVATDHLAARGDIPKECRDVIPFVLLLDKLFDSLNASTFSPPNGKIFRAAVKRNSPHHKLWQDSLKMLKTVKFMMQKSDGEKVEKSVPTLSNLIRTIEGFKSLWQLLFKII